MEELELCITVKAFDVGTKVRMLVEDSEDGIDLVTTNNAVEVKSIARTDGLPFGVDEDFATFVAENIPLHERSSVFCMNIARKAYYAGRKTK